MPAPDYADEYADCRARVRELLGGCTDAEASTVVPACPDWSVRDLCAHLAGVAAALVARHGPGEDVQAWVDAHVADRSSRSVGDLLDEWDEAGPAFEALMRKLPRGFAGLVYDVVAHEHDLRGALGRPGARDSDGVLACIDIQVAGLGRDLVSTGTAGALHLAAGGRTWTAGDGEPSVSLTTAPFDLFRLLGSRRSRGQVLAAGWEGDVEPFLPALAHMPLPEADLVE